MKKKTRLIKVNKNNDKLDKYNNRKKKENMVEKI